MVFLTIHPINFVVALVARLFGPVAYWRVEGVPSLLRELFEAIEPESLLNASEWNGLLQDAHDSLAVQTRASRVAPMTVRRGGADFSHIWLHWFAHQFEADVMCQHLAAAWSREQKLRRARVFHSGVARWARSANAAAGIVSGVERVYGSVLADGVWEIAKSLRVAAIAVVRTLWPSGVPPNLRSRRFRYAFTGIVPSHRSFAPDRLDFAFLVHRRLLPPEDCLYITARPLSEEQAKDLATAGALAVPFTAATGVFSLVRRVRLAVAIVHTVFRTLMRNGPAGDALAGMTSRALPMFMALRQFAVEVFVSGLDEGLFEPPATPMLAATGIRTIAWQHASVGFAHGPPNAGYRNRILEQSVYAAAEVCVWTPVDRDLLQDRGLLSSVGPKIHVTGPLMSGNAAWLTQSREHARRASGLKSSDDRRILAVFDLPTFVGGLRRAYRIPINRISREVHEAFFADLSAALDRFPSLDLLLKPKRGPNPRFFQSTIARDLTDPHGSWRRSGRVKVLDPDTDPYLPVAVSDFCVGMPFTSPVIAGVNAGRPSFWYDPNSFVNATWPQAAEALIVRGRDALFHRLAIVLRGNGVVQPAGITVNIDDPAAHFASIITGPAISSVT